MSRFAPKDFSEALESAKSRPQKPRQQIKRGKGIQTRSDAVGLKRRAKAGTTAKSKKPKKKKRAKVATRKSLVKKIDSLVFQIVCLMYETCVECGSVDRPTTGHVLSRRSYSTRWDFRNVFRQCWPCNYKAAMTAAASYHLWFVKKFGVDAFDRLYRDWTSGRKYTRLEIQNLVPEFEAQLETLKMEQ